jgi:hypothetical protein
MTQSKFSMETYIRLWQMDDVMARKEVCHNYRQLKDKAVASILRGGFKTGELCEKNTVASCKVVSVSAFA